MDQLSFSLPGLSPVAGKEIVARFDGGRLSSDGGVLLLRELDRRLGVCRRLASALDDRRDPTRVRHDQEDVIRARVLAIACGWEDGNDLNELRRDPAFKMACERLPETGEDLASQPTVSRLENGVSWRRLVRQGLSMIDLFCDSFARVPKRIVLDIDDTADRVHGQQQLRLFNSHAGGYCFEPIHIFEANSGKLVASLLRPGKRPSGAEAARLLRSVVDRIRRTWPRIEILVRGDSHYATPEVMDLLEARSLAYIFGLAINNRLKKISQPWSEDVATRRALAGKSKHRRYFQTAYQANTWSRERTVIARAEASPLGADVRFVVTNLAGPAKRLYEKIYCARGQAENLIKDLKLYTRSDRTSCHRWEANQFRLFLHTAAYWLLHGLRRIAPRRSFWRTATFETLRRDLIKIAVRVEEKRSRIKLALPTACPRQADLILLAGRIAASGP